MKTRILLARHGATVFSVEERFAGSSDIDLSDAGRELARKLGERLAKVKIDAFYCSDMKRAVQTATLVAEPHGVKPIGVVGLREIDHGSWEGKIHKEVEKKFPDQYAAWTADPFNIAPPGGETGLHVLSRAMPALLQIVANHKGQTVFVAAHKATNRLLLSSIMGIDPRVYRERIAQDLACLNILDFRDSSHGETVLLNDISHYGSPFEIQ
jgi:probable phosphoglycerate mutase